MNSRQLEISIGILAMISISFGILIYTYSEPTRLVIAQSTQLQTDLDEGMTLYAENCSVCHGLAGEGIGAIPPLDNQGLASTDSVSLFKIISRGLYGTSMPAWNASDGGPLSDYQIGTLVKLTQFGDWQETGDRVVNLGLAPMVPFATDPDPEILEKLAFLPDGEQLISGIVVFARECVACHGADGLGTALAPALNDQSVRDKSIDDLERVLLYGSPGTLMAGWENALTFEELSGVLTLITQWEQVELGAIPAPDISVPVTEQSLALGADLYAANCARCHAPEGQGTPRAPSINVKGFLAETSDGALQQIISLGIPETSMPVWGDKMLESEIQAIVGFIRAWEPTAPEVAEPIRGSGGPWWQTDNTSGTTRGQGRGSGKNGGPPNQEVPQTDETDTTNLTPTESVQANQPESDTAPDQEGNGGPPEWAGQGNQTGEDGHAGEPGSPQGHDSTPQSWWEALDNKAIGMVIGTAILALLMIISALWGLARLPDPDVGI